VDGTKLTRDLPSDLSLFFETLRDLHLLLLNLHMNAKPTLTCVATTAKGATVFCDLDPIQPCSHPQQRSYHTATQLFNANLKHANAPISHFHKMSSPHHTDGSVSGMAFQGICYVSLTLLNGAVEMLSSPIATAMRLFGITIPRDARHLWIKPAKHCQDFRVWFPIDANFTKGVLCGIVGILYLLGGALVLFVRMKEAEERGERLVQETAEVQAETDAASRKYNALRGEIHVKTRYRALLMGILDEREMALSRASATT
jgi:hypothetical protein